MRSSTMTSSTSGKVGRPSFLITIDTEGDNLWAAPREITTRNAAALPRFQTLCEAYGLKPTYLTNYEMACSPVFQEFARDVLKRGTAEIGMHLHAWNSPPLHPLTADDYRHQPYLIDYPDQLIGQKVDFLTKLLEDTFGVKMTSHRAGRWSMNEVYARILVEQGYRVDCSVTPHVSWSHLKGDPARQGGTDFSRFPDRPYTVDLTDISRAGDSPLLELPMTIMQSEHQTLRRIGQLMPRGSRRARAWDRLFPPLLWLRPNGRNLVSMLQIVGRAVRERRSYAEFMLHSSEFMAGGSPTFRSPASIEALYRDMEQLFSSVATSFVGATLSEFEQRFSRAEPAKAVGP
jgi:hypothetical protein